MDKATEFAMANTAGERALYADQANRNENGKVVSERVRVDFLWPIRVCPSMCGAGGQKAGGRVDGGQLHVC